jgi:hypothetical protein
MEGLAKLSRMSNEISNRNHARASRSTPAARQIASPGPQLRTHKASAQHASGLGRGEQNEQARPFLRIFARGVPTFRRGFRRYYPGSRLTAFGKSDIFVVVFASSGTISDMAGKRP